MQQGPFGLYVNTGLVLFPKPYPITETTKFRPLSRAFKPRVRGAKRVAGNLH